MADDEDMLRLLASIDRRLALLTASQARAMRKALEANLLRTEARIRMFDAIDGLRSSPEIAKAAGVGERSVQLFVQELLGAGLVMDTGTGSGRSIIVAHDDDALVRWSAIHEAQD